MDPLSLTASIIAILGAGGSIVSGLQKFASLWQVPDAILALSNEISDFKLVVQMTHDLLQDGANQANSNPTTHTESLKPILIRAKEKLLELEILIQYHLITHGRNGEPEFSKIAWVRECGKARAIQDKIRSIRMNLVAVIGILTSKAASRIELQVSELRFISNGISTQHRSLATSDQTITCQDSIERYFPTIMQAQERIGRQLVEFVSAYAASRIRKDTNSLESTSPRRPLSLSETAVGQWSLRLQSSRKGYHSCCKRGCICRCHRRHTWASSTKLQSYIGHLFIGYTGLPVANSCDDIRCEPIPETVVEVRYYFPGWFMTRVMEICVQVSRPLGVAQSLRINRVVWADSKLFLATRRGDVPGLKAILSSREGTPYDVAEDNDDTALLRAVKTGQTEICRVLLDVGADPTYGSKSNLTPYTVAWASILAKAWTPSVRQAFETIFSDPDLETYQFSLLHEAVLDLTSVSIETAYQRCQSRLDDTDSLRRTPLHWAARRGDLKVLQFLINSGAMIDKVDFVGRSPLSMAAGSGAQGCVQLLLRNGADVNLAVNNAWTALHQVGANSKPGSMKVLGYLIDYRADLDPLDREGATPLKIAIHFRDFKMALKLISLGADVHSLPPDGMSGLCDSVLHNNHQITTQLLRHGADHISKIRDYGSFLHLTAEHADVETLQILTSARLMTRDIQGKRRKDGLTALNVAKARSDVGPDWIDAFQAFLKSVDQAKNAPRTKPSNVAPQVLQSESSDSEDDVFIEASEQTN